MVEVDVLVDDEVEVDVVEVDVDVEVDDEDDDEDVDVEVDVELELVEVAGDVDNTAFATFGTAVHLLPLRVTIEAIVVYFQPNVISDTSRKGRIEKSYYGHSGKQLKTNRR